MRLEKYIPEGIEKTVENIGFGRVYPSAVISGRQLGDVFSDGRAVLIWHHCGFAWLAGEYDRELLNEVLRIKAENKRRLVLFTKDETAAEFFETKGAYTGRRKYFEYKGQRKIAAVPESFEVREFDAQLFAQLTGRVVPGLFWENAEQFMKYGKGFYLMHNNEAAAWAFSASADGKELDIGVETAEAYRRRGLAAAAAELMINYALSRDLKPVWACDAANSASAGLAEKLGFAVCAECTLVRL